MNRELFTPGDTPFNLAGEALDNSTTQEGEARVRALAEREARKAQETLKWDSPEYYTGVSVGICSGCSGYHVLKDGQCWNCAHPSALFAQILKPFKPEAKQ